MKKLWIVTVEFEFMAWAETDDEAEEFAEEATEDTDSRHSAYAREYVRSLATGWDNESIVYHDGDEDITVQDALEILEARKPDPNQLDLVKLIKERSNQNGAVGEAG